MITVLVILGAALGAPARFIVDLAFRRGFGAALPWGILAVNVAGSGLLGFLTTATGSPLLLAFLATGFCGALTTYSTLASATVELARTSRILAAGNLAAHIILGLAAAAGGHALGCWVLTFAG